MLIKNLGKVITGKTPSTSNLHYYGPGYLFITPTELHGNYRVVESEKHITEAGLNSIKNNSLSGFSILVGCIGWDMGNVAIVDKKCATNQQINSITDFIEDVNPYYIYYWLKGKKEFLFKKANVTRTPILCKGDFENIDIPLPNKTVQDSIANRLLLIDKTIEKNSEIYSELESLIQVFYDYWFVQFDFPDQNGNPYKSSGGVMEWSDELKREIPQGWGVSNLMENSLCNPIAAGVEHFEQKKYLATSNVIGETITDGDDVTFDNRESRANMQPQPYSVWFAKLKNSVKHISIPERASWFLDKYILSTGFEGIKCTKNSFAYIHAIIYSPYFEQHKDILAHGATQEGVNDDDLKNIKFAIPPERELRLFSERINPVLEQKFALLVENQNLSSLREFLLPMLMNGQVKISNQPNEA